MGKISVTITTKEEADDVRQSLEKNKTQLSPTPRNPLSRTKTGCCRHIFLFSLGVLVVLVLFVSITCLVDYQQGNFVAHTSELPREMMEVPREVVKYMVGVLYQTPTNLQNMFDSAVSQVKSLTSKTDEADPNMNTWEQIKEGEWIRVTNEQAEVKIKGADTTEFEDTWKQIKEGEWIRDTNEQQAEVKIKGADTTEFEDSFEEKLKILPQDVDMEIGADNDVENKGLQGIADFFLNILNDITSNFEAFEDDNENSPVDLYMIETNEIPRTIYIEESAKRESMTESTVLESDDLDKDAIEVIEEIFYDIGPVVTKSKEKFMNLFNDVSDSDEHIHGIKDLN